LLFPVNVSKMPVNNNYLHDKIKDNCRCTVNIGNNNVHTLSVGGKRLITIILKLNLNKE
jgi:hypothetical protein